MTKAGEFLQDLTGSDQPVVRVGVDTATLINLYLTIVAAAATILLIYFLLNK